MGCHPRSALFLLTESQARLDPEFIGPWGSKWKIKSESSTSMRYIRHKRMINGDAGVKNGIFIPTREKIWRSNWIREKRKIDPYNISEERFTKKYEIQIQVKGGMGGQNIRHMNSWFSCWENILHHIHSKIAQLGLNLKAKMIILRWRYNVSEFIDELLVIKITPIGRRK
ncbi:hypothetical protein Tco_0435929 [Tanacetum coccineum]